MRVPDAGDLHVRFDERDVQTGLWHGYSGTVKRKETANNKPNLSLPRDILTLPKTGVQKYPGSIAAAVVAPPGVC
jgi:hypothetical protein